MYFLHTISPLYQTFSHENKGYDHQLEKHLIVKQILFGGTLGNI